MLDLRSTAPILLDNRSITLKIGLTTLPIARSFLSLIQKLVRTNKRLILLKKP